MTELLSAAAPTQGTPPEEAAGRSRFAWWLGAITVAALVGRIVYMLWYHDGHPKVGTAGDPYYYHVQANFLADGRWFVSPFIWREFDRFVPSAYHPPLYSAYLGLWSVLGATSRLWHMFASVLLGTATVGVVGLLGREMAGERVGIAAAAVAALNPSLWVNDALLMSESLFALTLAASFWAAYRYRNHPSTRGAVALSAAIALAALTRGEAVLLYPLLALPIVLTGFADGRTDRLRRLGAMGIAAGLLIGPWVVFNAVRFHAFVPMTTSTGDLVAFANCDTTYYGTFMGLWDFKCLDGIPRSGDEVLDDRRGRELGLGYARDHLGRLPVVLMARVGRTFEVYRPGQSIRYNAFIEQRGEAVSRAGQWSFWLLGALSLVGLAELRRRGRTLVPPLAAVGLVVASSVTAYGFVRLRLPVDVMVCVLAPLGIAGLHHRFRPPPPSAAQGGTA